MPKKHKMKGKNKTRKARLDEMSWYHDLQMSWGHNPYEKEDMGETY